MVCNFVPTVPNPLTYRRDSSSFYSRLQLSSLLVRQHDTMLFKHELLDGHRDLRAWRVHRRDQRRSAVPRGQSSHRPVAPIARPLLDGGFSVGNLADASCTSCSAVFKTIRTNTPDC